MTTKRSDDLRPVVFSGRWYDEIVRVGSVPADPRLVQRNAAALAKAKEYLGKPNYGAETV